eukprot:2206159-Prymnesium_polylepis.1
MSATASVRAGPRSSSSHCPLALLATLVLGPLALVLTQSGSHSGKSAEVKAGATPQRPGGRGSSDIFLTGPFGEKVSVTRLNTSRGWHSMKRGPACAHNG